MSFIAHLLIWFAQWCDDSFFGAGVRNSVWLFPFIEILHLIGLGVLGGTVLILNMRLLGFQFRSEPVSELAKDVQPWMRGGLAVMLISGFFLFSSESVKMYGNPAFRIKMAALLAAIIFTFTLHRKATMSDLSEMPHLWPKLAAMISLALWSTVGLAGRAIGYVGR